MVAYSFQKGFAWQVEQRLKVQTIRGPRRRHARRDEPIQLYTGMRTKRCRKLVAPDPVCLSVDPIVLQISSRGEHKFNDPAGVTVELGGIELDDEATEALALDDGFNVNRWDFEHSKFIKPPDARTMMAKWWAITHGPGRFDGFLIRWG